MTVKKDLYQGTSLTKAYKDQRDARATRVHYVTGLENTRNAIDSAIDEAVSASGNAHPDNIFLPLKTATGTLVGAGPDGLHKARVVLRYDKRGNSNADGDTFTKIANVSIRMVDVQWYAETFPEPLKASDEATVKQIYTAPDDPSHREAVPSTVPVAIMVIQIPVSLTSSPIASMWDEFGKINSNSFTISDLTFSPYTLYNAGLRQGTVAIDNGASVSYEHDVAYTYIAREDGWYESYPTVNASNVIVAKKRLMYQDTTFSRPPT